MRFMTWAPRRGSPRKCNAIHARAYHLRTCCRRAPVMPTMAQFKYSGTEMPQRRSTQRMHPASPVSRSSTAARRNAAGPIEIRAVRKRDLDEIVAIDARVTGVEKRAYWESIHRRYGHDDARGRQFLVATS